MPDNDPYQNAPHLQHRLGRTAAESHAAGAEAKRPVDLAALLLDQRIADGDEGAVRRYVHELEHGLGPLQVDPWRLLERLALRFMPTDPPEDPEPGSGAAAAEASDRAGDSTAAA